VTASTAVSIGPCEGEEKKEDNGGVSFERTFDETSLFRICFVCTGNICRSPMAETIFNALIKKAGVEKQLAVISAGTGDWHVGEPSDDRTLAALSARGYNGSGHRGRQFDTAWFQNLDLVVVFDRSQERILKTWATTEQDRAKIHLLLSFAPEQSPMIDVPDPYYSDAALFDQVLAIIERACDALFRQIMPGIRQGAL
jgi:protein-tyrosine phosphatase